MNTMRKIEVEDRVPVKDPGLDKFVEAANENTDKRSYRLTNIDIVRGLVILIMALDHVRDFMMTGGVQDPMAQPDIGIGLYMTRWITHLCAPTFIFLAGTSVGLMSGRKSAKELAGFVFKRGVWLVIMELTVISTAWTFTPFGEPAVGGLTIIILQIIWALGASMIILSGALFMGPRACLMLGLAIIVGHNLLDPFWPTGTAFGDGTDPFWIMLHAQNSVIFGQFYVNTFYPLIPCAGLMLVGFGSSFIFQKPAETRNAFLINAGLVMIGAFIALRLADIYGDPNPWQVQEYGVLATVFDFMNVSKYPASLLYLLVTLGIMSIVCGFADRLRGKVKDILVMFGRVPFAFYVAHLYLIHALAMLLGIAQGHPFDDVFKFFPFYPEGYGVDLVGVYAGWIITLALLYPFCKWVAEVKSRRKDWWLSYL